jgi:hypothetical protein
LIRIKPNEARRIAANFAKLPECRFQVRTAEALKAPYDEVK